MRLMGVQRGDEALKCPGGYYYILCKKPSFVCNAASETACQKADCSLMVYMGFTGEDLHGVAFQTGFQIQQVNQYSVSSLFDNIYQQVLIWHLI